MTASDSKPHVQTHALAVRIAHWLMALSILIMIGSGWRIYDASPIFGVQVPGLGHTGRRCRNRAGSA